MPFPIDVIEIPNLTKVYHLGPPLSLGPLPAAFYFSLSGEESLALNPYNQPAVFLSEGGIRVFSITLPGHEDLFPHPQAIKEWAEQLADGRNIIREFIEICKKCLDFLINEKYIDPKNIGTVGLSRGSFIATQLAANDERIHTILGFAPVTYLESLNEFKDLVSNPIIQQISLENLSFQLITKKLRYYIGNHDSLVGTQNCFAFIYSLSTKAYEKTHRFSPIEMIIYPSVGHKGHGTPPEIFTSGSSWLVSTLSR